MVERKTLLDSLLFSLDHNPVTALLGPRQCGKTTLARSVHQLQPIHHFDFENPIDRTALDNPIMVLHDLTGLVVLDEIHRMPELYEIIRVLVDDQLCRVKFLVLGSSSPQIVREVSETLAGRIGFVDMSGFNLQEVSDCSWRNLWLRGGFPGSFLVVNQQSSINWREDFTRTFLERDIPLLGFRIPPEAMRKFWTMLAHYHGQKWNAAEFSRSPGKTEKTAAAYLDILCGTFMVRKLQPWYVNMKKRQAPHGRVLLWNRFFP
ncbi:MAG: ATP-binding protein [Candidatus Fermentibacteria bacterium]|nr:ATP-binding protein [Candidatus Fermentibacteria bacterium]